MGERPARGRVVPVRNLCEFFRTSIDEVIAQQGVDLDPHATHYVVNTMTLFSRSEKLYENDRDTYGIRPLALMLADAVDTRTVEERQQILRRIGDLALFIAGFFVDSLASRAVDVDYYIHMGENAYGSLSEETRGTFHGNAFADIYRELAVNFQVVIDVLNEVRCNLSGESDADLLRTYEIWRKTGSKRAEKLLRQQGVVPFSEAKARRH